MNETERRTGFVLSEEWVTWRGSTESFFTERVVPRLVTPLHERALEACKEMAAKESVCGGLFGPVGQMILDVGREALAADKPKERWKAIPRLINGPDWDVTHTGKKHWHGPFSAKQATEVADALNRVDREQQK